MVLSQLHANGTHALNLAAATATIPIMCLSHPKRTDKVLQDMVGQPCDQSEARVLQLYIEMVNGIRQRIGGLRSEAEAKEKMLLLHAQELALEFHAPDGRWAQDDGAGHCGDKQDPQFLQFLREIFLQQAVAAPGDAHGPQLACTESWGAMAVWEKYGEKKRECASLVLDSKHLEDVLRGEHFAPLPGWGVDMQGARASSDRTAPAHASMLTPERSPDAAMLDFVEVVDLDKVDAMCDFLGTAEDDEVLDCHW
jgi:hypothetical protein